MSDWQIARLGTVGSFRRGVSYNGAGLNQPGPMLVGMGQIKPEGGLDLSDARTYGGKVKPEHFIGEQDVAVVMTDLTQTGGLLGSPARAPAELVGRLIVSHHLQRFRCEASLDPQFAQYLLMGPSWRAHVHGMATGTTVRAVSPEDAARFEFRLPTLAEQRAIAGVLGALDDKIESNRKLEELLLRLAQAEFDLRFGDSEIVLPLASLAEVVDCLHTRKPNRQDSGRALLQLSNIAGNGTIIPANHFPITQSDYERWTAPIEASEGDLVITNVGRVGAVGRVPAGFRAALGRNMTAVRPVIQEDRAFLAAALTNARVRRVMMSLVDSGTIMDALNVHAIRRVVVPDADPAARAAYGELTDPIFLRADRCISEALSLGALRDALLPELLSGRLRVRDAEGVLEGAV